MELLLQFLMVQVGFFSDMVGGLGSTVYGLRFTVYGEGLRMKGLGIMMVQVGFHSGEVWGLRLVVLLATGGIQFHVSTPLPVACKERSLISLPESNSIPGFGV